LKGEGIEFYNNALNVIKYFDISLIII